MIFLSISSRSSAWGLYFSFSNFLYYWVYKCLMISITMYNLFASLAPFVSCTFCDSRQVIAACEKFLMIRRCFEHMSLFLSLFNLCLFCEITSKEYKRPRCYLSLTTIRNNKMLEEIDETLRRVVELFRTAKWPCKLMAWNGCGV